MLVCQFDKRSRAAGGVVTFITNRLGDTFLVLGVVLTIIRGNMERGHGGAAIIFVAAAFTKRAQ